MSTAVSLRICVAAVVGLTAAAGGQSSRPAVAESGSALFDALGSDDADARLQETLAQFPASQRQAIEQRLARRKIFHSLLQVPASDQEFPAEIIFSARHRVEMAAFVLATSDSAAADAADLAGSIRLFYEWEGEPDSPMAEARDAERWAAAHPGSSANDFVQLLLMHRYRCAFEAAERTITRGLAYVDPEFRQSRGQALTKMRLDAAAAYRAAWDRARNSHDAVTAAIASDIDTARFIYVPSREHPRTFPAVPQNVANETRAINAAVIAAVFKDMKGGLPASYVLGAEYHAFVRPGDRQWAALAGVATELRTRVDRVVAAGAVAGEIITTDDVPNAARIVPSEEVNALIRQGPKDQDGYPAIQQKYQTRDVLSLSKPVITDDRLDVLVYYSHGCGSLCGSVGYVWLHRTAPGDPWIAKLALIGGA